MDVETLARLVRDMRRHQRDYHRTPNREGLNACQDYERRVDAAVKEVLEPKGPDLFDSLPCDHAWEMLTGGEWECQKCGTRTNLTPRGKAGAPEKPPPGSGGEP